MLVPARERRSTLEENPSRAKFVDEFGRYVLLRKACLLQNQLCVTGLHVVTHSKPPGAGLGPALTLPGASKTTHFTQSKSNLGSACHQSGTLGLKYGQAEAPSDEDLDRVKNLLLAQTTNGRGFRAPRFSVRIRGIWGSDQDYTSRRTRKLAGPGR